MRRMMNKALYAMILIFSLMLVFTLACERTNIGDKINKKPSGDEKGARFDADRFDEGRFGE